MLALLWHSQPLPTAPSNYRRQLRLCVAWLMLAGLTMPCSQRETMLSLLTGCGTTWAALVVGAQKCTSRGMTSNTNTLSPSLSASCLGWDEWYKFAREWKALGCLAHLRLSSHLVMVAGIGATSEWCDRGAAFWWGKFKAFIT